MEEPSQMLTPKIFKTDFSILTTYNMAITTKVNNRFCENRVHMYVCIYDVI